MSKARKEALDWLPKRKDGRKRCYQCNDDDLRGIYAKGYRKAEKDLELTWEDIEEIDDLLDELLPSRFDDVLELKGAYEEVLKRFNDLKK